MTANRSSPKAFLSAGEIFRQNSVCTSGERLAGMMAAVDIARHEAMVDVSCFDLD